MAKVEAIKRSKIRWAELVLLYKEDKEWDAQSKNDDRVNGENADMDKKSKNCGSAKR